MAVPGGPQPTTARRRPDGSSFGSVRSRPATHISGVIAAAIGPVCRSAQQACQERVVDHHVVLLVGRSGRQLVPGQVGEVEAPRVVEEALTVASEHDDQAVGRPGRGRRWPSVGGRGRRSAHRRRAGPTGPSRRRDPVTRRRCGGRLPGGTARRRPRTACRRRRSERLTPGCAVRQGEGPSVASSVQRGSPSSDSAHVSRNADAGGVRTGLPAEHHEAAADGIEAVGRAPAGGRYRTLGCQLVPGRRPGQVQGPDVVGRRAVLGERHRRRRTDRPPGRTPRGLPTGSTGRPHTTSASRPGASADGPDAGGRRSTRRPGSCRP